LPVLNVQIQSNLGPALLFADRMRQSLAAPARDGAGLGDGIRQSVHVYADAMRRRFASASAGDGTWPPLAKGTAKAKARRGLPDRILHATGQLEASLEIGAPYNVFEIGPASVTYGTAARVAWWHHTGAGHNPRRTLLVPPRGELLTQCIAPLQQAWRKVIHAHLAAAVRVAT
jgi:hypothetical protein